MTLKTIAIVAGLAAALGAGTAFAQGAPEQQGPYQGQYQGGYQGPPPNQGEYQGRPANQGGYQGQPSYQGGAYPGMHHHHPMMTLIRDEVRAGRISHKEGTRLERKIHEMHAERRAERQARFYGERGAPPSAEMQQH